MPASGTTTVGDTTDADTISVSARSATAQLARATTQAVLSLAFTIYNFGAGPTSFVTRIGPDDTPGDWSASWRIKVNHRTSMVGADDVLLDSGDEVLWSFGDSSAPELDVTGPTAPVGAGTEFTVTVGRYDDNGVRTAGAGATVTYGTATAAANAAGVATLVANGSGRQAVTATVTGAVRDSIEVCGYAADTPTTCGLSATAPAATPASGATTLPLALTVRTTSGERAITLNIPLPTRGGSPVALRPALLAGESMTPSERRRVISSAASGLAAHLNAQMAGEWDLTPGLRWRPSWLSGAAYVTPLATGEGLLGITGASTEGTAAVRERARGFTRHIARCEITGTARAVERTDYAMVVLSPGSVRADLIDCALRCGDHADRTR